MEKMLINATQTEEIRVALVKNNHLYDLDIECPAEVKKKGNIYKAIITRCEPSLDAVFVEYGAKRQGFLPVKEIATEYLRKFDKGAEVDKPSLASLVHEGQEILVQVDKEGRGNKGAALTTYITLAGCYLVLMPNNPKSGGISRRIDGEDRTELRDTLNALRYDEGMGVIIRTAGVGKKLEELQNDLDMLCNQWHAILQAYKTQLAPCLIHQEGDVITRSIRDNLRKSIDEIIIDDQVYYVKAKQYVEQVKPDFLPHLKLYINTIPLFTFYQIESQIETAFKREVPLPSGGSLVIDRTEALISIDVNSAKATCGTDIEATAVNTNLEAADEIARQLRLRDLGGLIVIDFIDMGMSKNHREVENCLKEAVKADRARIQIGRISLRFGLLEMSRQRLRPSLGEGVQEICPRCQGRGTIRNLQSHCLAITRLIEEETLKERTAEIQVQLPSEMATFLINEKREFILNIEKRHGVKVLIIANPYLKSPQYTITSVKAEMLKHKKSSYDLIQQPELVVLQTTAQSTAPDEPVVKTFAGSLQPSYSRMSAQNFIQRLWQKLFAPLESPTPSSENKEKSNIVRKVPGSTSTRSQTARRRSTNRLGANRSRNIGVQSHKEPHKERSLRLRRNKFESKKSVN